MDSSKVKVSVSTISGKICSVIGYFLAIILLISLIGNSTNTTPSNYSLGFDIFMYILFFSLAGFLIFKGITIKRRIKRFKKYVGLISIEHITTLQNIASSTNQSIDFVTKDIQKLIDKKFFPNAYLDMKNGEVIIEKPAFGQAVPLSNQNVKTETEDVKCSSCGANNIKVKGAVGICEYCGSPLK